MGNFLIFGERWKSSVLLDGYDFPAGTLAENQNNNAIERQNREIRRRTGVVGAFSDVNATLMLVCARLRYMESSLWGTKLYLNKKHLETLD